MTWVPAVTAVPAGEKSLELVDSGREAATQTPRRFRRTPPTLSGRRKARSPGKSPHPIFVYLNFAMAHPVIGLGFTRSEAGAEKSAPPFHCTISHEAVPACIFPAMSSQARLCLDGDMRCRPNG